MKVNISDPKSGKTYHKEVESKGLIGLKIGEKFDGGVIGLEGYKLQITGGSDKDGFPMVPYVEGTVRKKLLLTGPPGYRPREKGERRRKYVRGNTLSEDIVQVNTKIIEYGKKSLEEFFGGEEESKEEK